MKKESINWDKAKEYIFTNKVLAIPKVLRIKGEGHLSEDSEITENFPLPEIKEGYLVKYLNGYVTWLPKEVFEEKSTPLSKQAEVLPPRPRKNLYRSRQTWDDWYFVIEAIQYTGDNDADVYDFIKQVNIPQKDSKNLTIEFDGKKRTIFPGEYITKDDNPFAVKSFFLTPKYYFENFFEKYEEDKFLKIKTKNIKEQSIPPESHP